jgi:hypothetical protein
MDGLSPRAAQPPPSRFVPAAKNTPCVFTRTECGTLEHSPCIDNSPWDGCGFTHYAWQRPHSIMPHPLYGSHCTAIITGARESLYELFIASSPAVLHGCVLYALQISEQTAVPMCVACRHWPAQLCVPLPVADLHLLPRCHRASCLWPWWGSGCSPCPPM